VERAVRDPAPAFAHCNKRAPSSISDFPVSSSRRTSTPGDLAADPKLKPLFLWGVAESFKPPRALFWEGDSATHVFHLLEGCLRVSRMMHDGRRAILGFRYAGDLLGLSFDETYLFTAEAVTAVRLKRTPRRHFHELVDNSPDLRQQLLAEIRSELTAAQDHIIRLGHTSAEERVASFLLNIARRAGSHAATPVEIEVPCGLDIADYLGLTVETVSREISKLKRNRLISKRAHKIVLHRFDGLREVARMDVNEPYGRDAKHEKIYNENAFGFHDFSRNCSSFSRQRAGQDRYDARDLCGLSGHAAGLSPSYLRLDGASQPEAQLMGVIQHVVTKK
jgi:CRP/FNR family transcriptional regulator, anaerobic regulatory protein